MEKRWFRASCFRYLILVGFVIWGCTGQNAGPDVLDASRLNDGYHVDVYKELCDAEDDIRDSDTDSQRGVESLLKGPARYVNPFIGTGGNGFDIGSAFVGAAVPFGMVKPGPDTTDKYGRAWQFHCSGYYYNDPYLLGISQMHVHGTGAPDYGMLLFMPLDRKDQSFLDGHYRVRFSHEKEEAFAGYYGVDLDNGVKIELTTTGHCGIHRYTWNRTGAFVGVDPTYALVKCSVKDIEVDGPVEGGDTFYGRLHYNGALSGRDGGFDLYFAVKFSQKIKEIYKKDKRFILGFGDVDSLEVRIGLSMVDVDGAKANLGECEELGFDDAVRSAIDRWNKYLSVVEIEGVDEHTKRIFYTSLYHALLMPDLLTDVDNRYRGFDHKVHKGVFYSDFSLWDTFRTVHPLYTLLYPEVQKAMVDSLYLMATQGGTLPRWPIALGYSGSMFGTPADVTIADSALKGIEIEHKQELLDKMLFIANGARTVRFSGRDGGKDYVKYGYVPADLYKGSVSKTVEYSLSDFCIAQFADMIGKKDVAEEFRKRAESWKNLFDKKQGFIAPKTSKGAFLQVKPKGFESNDAYIEGTPWQYLFDLPHATEGLVEALGGKSAFFEKLNDFFKNSKIGRNLLPDPYYWHGNEPALYAAFMFSEVGRYGDTSKWVKNIRDKCYADQAMGLAGNDDAGTLGAWYVFAMLGIYPRLCKGDYVVFSPGVKRAVLHLKGGDLIIERGDKLMFNQKVIKGNLIQHGELIKGGVLRLK